MAPPKGNQFWKLRSKHGRDKLFASPELMWQAACEYFEWCDQNPLVKTEQLKKAAVVMDFDTLEETTMYTVDIPTARPYTLHGLCHYLDCDTSYFAVFKSRLSEKEKADENGFFKVITRVEEIIYRQKFEGAAIGAFNANIIARDLGLVEKKDITATTEAKVEIDYTKLSDGALEEIAKLSGGKPVKGAG